MSELTLASPILEYPPKILWESGPHPPSPHVPCLWLLSPYQHHSVLAGLQMRNTQAHSLRFPKPKDEGWVLVLGEVDSREVIAVKRVGYRRGRSSVQLAFYTPERVGRVIYTLYMMSDCYLGLDQQYDICLHVVESSLQAQVNSEFMDELDISD